MEALSCALQEHFGHGAKWQENRSQALKFKCSDADVYYLRVITHKFYKWCCREENHDGKNHDKDGCQLERVVESLTQALEFRRAIVKTTYWLEALADAQAHGEYEESNSGYGAHARNGCVAIRCGRHVKDDGGGTLKALADKARKTCGHNVTDIVRSEYDIFESELADSFAPQEEGQENYKADELGEACGQARSGDSHVQNEHEDRVAHHIKNGAHQETYHSEGCFALISEDVVHGEARHDKWSGDENICDISFGIRRDGLSAAKDHYQLVKEDKADYLCDYGQSQGAKETCRSSAGGTFIVVFAKES